VLAYFSRSSSALKPCYLSRNLDGLEDQCFFDGAFATKWVQPRETLWIAPTDKRGGGMMCGKSGVGWVCFVLEVERGL
jgi:hypothetical protein